MKCRECKEFFRSAGRGSKQVYCSTKCRMRAYRKRVAKERASIPLPKRSVTHTDRKSAKLIAALREKVAQLERELAQAKKRPIPSVPCPVCGRKVKLIEGYEKFSVPKHRHDLIRSKTCSGSNMLVEADGSFAS